MLCRKPFMKGILPYGCGQCLPCRVNRRRLWTHRIMLESFSHEKSCFITLTYNKENLPDGSTLVPVHVRNFLKRLRERVSPCRVRYYVVGEYGEDTFRPHYHAALFGLGEEDSREIEDSWGQGFVHVGSLTQDSAQYICGYVTKKMTSKDDPRLKGRYPEFSRMSRKPGIGALAIPVIADSLNTDGGCILLEREGDVPNVLKHGRRALPLGRYLTQRLRKAVGGDHGALQMSEFKKALHAEEMVEELKLKKKSETFRQYLFDKSAQQVLNQSSKLAILNSKKGSL